MDSTWARHDIGGWGTRGTVLKINDFPSSYVCLPEGNNNNIGIMDYFRFIYGMNIWDFFICCLAIVMRCGIIL